MFQEYSDGVCSDGTYKKMYDNIEIMKLMLRDGNWCFQSACPIMITDETVVTLNLLFGWMIPFMYGRESYAVISTLPTDGDIWANHILMCLTSDTDSNSPYPNVKNMLDRWQCILVNLIDEAGVLPSEIGFIITMRRWLLNIARLEFRAHADASFKDLISYDRVKVSSERVGIYLSFFSKLRLGIVIWGAFGSKELVRYVSSTLLCDVENEIIKEQVETMNTTTLDAGVMMLSRSRKFRSQTARALKLKDKNHR